MHRIIIRTSGSSRMKRNCGCCITCSNTSRVKIMYVLHLYFFLLLSFECSVSCCFIFRCFLFFFVAEICANNFKKCQLNYIFFFFFVYNDVSILFYWLIAFHRRKNNFNLFSPYTFIFEARTRSI